VLNIPATCTNLVARKTTSIVAADAENCTAKSGWSRVKYSSITKKTNYHIKVFNILYIALHSDILHDMVFDFCKTSRTLRTVL